jgi:hypothetical protein
MVPRIETAPNGKWHCPECPALGPDGDFSYPSQPELQPENAQQPPPLPIRESSIASSSRSFAYPMTKGQSKYPGKGKGKARAMPTDDSELEFATPSLVNSRNKQKSNKKSKPQRENSTDDELSASPPRQRKRMRMRVHSPAPPLPRIRLRLAPQKGKGKERDDDEPPKGLFDGILRVGDRDTTKTVIQYRDKQWFERSRLVAEVGWTELFFHNLLILCLGKTRPSSCAAAPNIRDSRYSHPRSFLATSPIFRIAVISNVDIDSLKTIRVPGSLHSWLDTDSGSGLADSADTDDPIWSVRYQNMVRCTVSRRVRYNTRWEAVDM